VNVARKNRSMDVTKRHDRQWSFSRGPLQYIRCKLFVCGISIGISSIDRWYSKSIVGERGARKYSQPAVALTRARIISISHTTRLCNVIGFRRYNRASAAEISGFQIVPARHNRDTKPLSLSSSLSLIVSLFFSSSLYFFSGRSILSANCGVESRVYTPETRPPQTRVATFDSESDASWFSEILPNEVVGYLVNDNRPRLRTQ